MDKNFSPTSRSMQPQNLSVSMAGTPGTPMMMAAFLHSLSSSTGKQQQEERNSGVPTQLGGWSRGKKHQWPDGRTKPRPYPPLPLPPVKLGRPEICAHMYIMSTCF